MEIGIRLCFGVCGVIFGLDYFFLRGIDFIFEFFF